MIRKKIKWLMFVFFILLTSFTFTSCQTISKSKHKYIGEASSINHFEDITTQSAYYYMPGRR